jgi:hypothetical protein
MHNFENQYYSEAWVNKLKLTSLMTKPNGCIKKIMPIKLTRGSNSSTTDPFCACCPYYINFKT